MKSNPLAVGHLVDCCLVATELHSGDDQARESEHERHSDDERHNTCNGVAGCIASGVRAERGVHVRNRREQVTGNCADDGQHNNESDSTPNDGRGTTRELRHIVPPTKARYKRVSKNGPYT